VNPSGARGKALNERPKNARTLSSVWRSRAIIVVMILVITEITLVAGGVKPHLLLVGVIVLVGSALVFLALDLADIVMPMKWPANAGPPRKTDGADWRVGTLRMLLLNERRSEGANNRMHAVLVRLIDDHLRDEHRVEREVDPEAAAAIIGPELTSFVNTTPESDLTQAGEVARIVTLIENLDESR
jgi:hypothetical protein